MVQQQFLSCFQFICLASVGVAGKLGDAEALLDRVIELGLRPGRQPNVGAHVARGTARALTRSLAGAPPRASQLSVSASSSYYIGQVLSSIDCLLSQGG